MRGQPGISGRLTARDGAHAIEKAHSLDPHVILLDIGLPGLDGYEVARRLRAQGCRALMVALTGYGQTGDVANRPVSIIIGSSPSNLRFSNTCCEPDEEGPAGPAWAR
jgi:CheY-like chemotaxis protein